MNNYFQQARFIQSATTPDTLPTESGLEVAFSGRSNSGKSSAINKICSQKSLARTSKTPGRTQLINFFGLPDNNCLVDLPGYGYAKVPEKVKLQWQRFIEQYLTQRQTLRGVVVIMDIRHPLTDHDNIMLYWASQSQVPVHILLNKSDKLKRGVAKSSFLSVRQKLQAEMEGVSVQMFSARTGEGLDEVWSVLSGWLNQE